MPVGTCLERVTGDDFLPWLPPFRNEPTRCDGIMTERRRRLGREALVRGPANGGSDDDGREREPPSEATEEAADQPVGGENTPNELARQVDRFVAECIRHRRRELGMNQREFGRRVGVSLQQVHKYERQLNRVSAGRLFVIASVLKVPIQYFFAAAGQDESGRAKMTDATQSQLLHHCGLLRDPAHQRAVAGLCRLLLEAERNGKR